MQAVEAGILPGERKRRRSFLSPRNWVAFHLLATGLSNDSMSKFMSLSIGCIENHIAAIYEVSVFGKRPEISARVVATNWYYRRKLEFTVANQTPLTAKELIKKTGLGTYQVKEMRFPVNVLDTKNVWGNILYLIEPIGGTGQSWVAAGLALGDDSSSA